MNFGSFYTEDEIKKNLTCPCCHKTYDDPRIVVPCAEILCFNCIRDHTCENKKEFKCFFCKTKHPIPESGFKSNKNLNEILKLKAKTAFTSRSIEQFKSKLTELQELEQNLKRKVDKPSVTVREHCCSLRKQIDCKTKSLQEELTKCHEGLLKQVNDYEEICLQTIERNLNNYRNTLNNCENLRRDYDNWVSGFEIDLDLIEENIKKTDKNIENIKDSISSFDFNWFEFKKEKLDFLENKDPAPQNSIGELKLTTLESYTFKGELIKTICINRLGVYTIAKLKDDIFCSAGSNQDDIKIWDLNTEKVFFNLKGHSPLLPIEDKYLLTGSNISDINVWHWPTGKLIKTLKGHNHIDSSRIRYIIQLSDEKIASCCEKALIIWNFKTESILMEFIAHEREIFSLILLSNTYIASCSEDKTIKIWNQSNGKLKNTLKGHCEQVYCIVELKNQTLASGSSDRTIRIWNLNTGITLKILTGPNEKIYSLAMLKNGNLVSGSEDSNIVIWDTEEGQAIKTLQGHTKYVFCLLVLDDGRLISTSDDTTIKLWR